MVIKRTIQKKIEENFFKGKIIIIYGPRQVGKTTLISEIKKNYPQTSFYLNCDEPDIRDSLADITSTQIKSLIGNRKVIFIDEAQRVKNIGLTLKLAVDNFPKIQFVATGSSSFDLSNEIVEPLTGRKYEFHLYPLSIRELKTIYNDLEIKRLLGERLIFGSYPEIVKKPEEKEFLLKEITRSYLYKDILRFQNIKNPDILEKLLQALALQISSKISYNELASLVGINKKTVQSYIQILEKAFIIFRLKPYSKNLRKEIGKLNKIYFFDTGIRNAIINNLNPLNLRTDTGPLWENFLIAERIKTLHNHGLTRNSYFWRTYQKQEIDYLEEDKDKLSAYELKWKEKKIKTPAVFAKTYPKTKLKLINKDNFQDFLNI